MSGDKATAGQAPRGLAGGGPGREPAGAGAGPGRV